MAMLVKPSDPHPGSGRTDPTVAVKKRSSSNDEVDLKTVCTISEAERVRWVQVLENSLLSSTATFVGPLPLDSSCYEEKDDRELLDDWLGSYNPIPNNVSWLNNRERHIRRSQSSDLVRKRKGTKHSSLLDNVWKAVNPTKGWWLERPPTLDQLYSSSRVAAGNYYGRNITRKERVKEILDRRKAEKIRQSTVASNDEYVSLKLFKEGKLVLKIGLDKRKEFRKLDVWLWNRDTRNISSLHINRGGLRGFIQSTGIPPNENRKYRHYWAAQAVAALEYTPQQLLMNHYEKCDPMFYEESWAKSSTEADRLQQWLAFRGPLNGHFMPDKPLKPKSLFERKLNAFMLAIDRTDLDNQDSIDRLKAVHKQLFGYELPNSLFNKYFPIIAVGESYGEFDKEYKKQLIRESNEQHSLENKGKVWPDLGLPNRCKADALADELTLRITDRIFSEENIRNLIRDEMRILKAEIREEMENFTVALVSEFEVAMEDCVGQVVSNAVEAVTVANTVSKPTTKPLRNFKGFSSNDQGILLPD